MSRSALLVRPRRAHLLEDLRSGDTIRTLKYNPASLHLPCAPDT